MHKSIAIYMMGAVCLMAVGAAAQETLTGTVSLGLFFDPEAENTNVSMLAPGSVQAYLILTEATVDFIGGWEAKVTLTGDGSSVTGMELPTGSTAVLTGPDDWSAMFDVPLPANPLTKLAVFTLSTDAAEDTFLFLGPTDDPSGPDGLPALFLSCDCWVGVPVASGDPTLPVASINSSTPDEHTSWGAVKGLFR